MKMKAIKFNHKMKLFQALLTIAATHQIPTSASSDNGTIIDFSTAWQKCNMHTSDRWMICPEGMMCHFANETELESIWTFGCMWCPEDGTDCVGAVNDLRQRFVDSEEEAAYSDEKLLAMCKNTCEAATLGQACSREKPCTPGSSFCDFSSTETGVCQKCPSDVNDCYQEGYLSSEVEKRECVKCSLECAVSPTSLLFANEKEFQSYPIDKIVSNATDLFGTGMLIDCSDLILHGVETCPGAEGRVCLIHDYTLNTLYWQLSDKAERSGCSAVILYGNYAQFEQNEPCVTQHSYDHLGIPFVCIPYNDGKILMNNIISEHDALVLASYQWLFCAIDTTLLGDRCTNSIPCSSSNEFCSFHRKVENGVYVEGWCKPCNEDPLYCYFDPDGGMPRIPEFVKSCVQTCNADIYFEKCKFCPSALTGSELEEGRLDVQAGETQCSFCPDDDVLYSHRKFPMFETEVECWQMQAFFERIKYSEDSLNCRLAQSFNHICGCNGVGYAGAATDAKKAALVWMPRIAAILSIMGSSSIMYDIIRVPTRREKLLYQLLFTLSIFDIIGSLAYAFTSLPIPYTDYIYGSKGNQATCTAQGFFIQVGTTACFINSSLSSYYYLTIIRGLNEETLRKKRLAFFLPPIIVGLTFAFAGIPWYYDMVIWCNNMANFWPEIPVIFSIAWATVVMGAVCAGVIKQDRSSRRYSTRRRSSNSISTMVVKQSFLFVGSFYLTWIPYLALQYVWATGRAFTSYGFVLYAATSVPLQGFFNCIVYAKPRYFRRGSTITNASSIATPKCKNLWCCKKNTPSTIELKKLDDAKENQSEIQSTAKLTKPPEKVSSVVQNENGKSGLHQSVLNSSMLGEQASITPSVNDDQVTAIVNDDGDDNDEVQSSSGLHESVLKSSMLGEDLQELES